MNSKIFTEQRLAYDAEKIAAQAEQSADLLVVTPIISRGEALRYQQAVLRRAAMLLDNMCRALGAPPAP